MQQKFEATSQTHQKKIHPAIEHLQELQSTQPSALLEAFLSNLAKPKSIDSETFIEGVRQFIRHANSNPLDKKSSQGREALYETVYSGLHYNDDLATLWNTTHTDDEPIKGSALTTLAPRGWDYVLQDGFRTLIYKGHQPAEALDELVKGPTVIDCGMFTQLSLWFGLRYMLGNERFNQCFGRAPFFITLLVYNGIENSSSPYSGNPLYSFLSKKEAVKTFSVTVKHLTNSPLYLLKHPGGSYGGENCIVIGDQYYIFDPHSESTQMTEASVLNLLRDAFNLERRPYDVERLSLYEATPEEFHPKLLKTYGELIKAAEHLRDTCLSAEEFSQVKQNPELELAFDLDKFSIWLQRVENTTPPDSIDYLAQSIDDSLMPPELLDVIPFENKTSMDFSKFKEESPQQKELIIMTKQFCQRMMAGESMLVILTGKAGVGKTASAVCAAKELTAQGKKAIWISEVMVKGWLAQAKSMADLDNCGLEIDKLLAQNPDVVFLDDDNLAGFGGKLLLEKIYSWFVNNPGKGLFITSNEPIGFKDCYGYQLGGQYDYPPFNDYSSPQYLNWQVKADLAGGSLRRRRDGQSIGAIVSDLSWKTNHGNLHDVELIPAFDETEELAPIRKALRETGSMFCSAYDKLQPVQKRWLHVSKAGAFEHSDNGKITYIKPFLTATPSHFEKTTCQTIALEIREDNGYFGKKINLTSMDQLIRALNYAHDQGGRRIILINQTSYSTDQLLIQIKAQLPKFESERTWSRLELLLCETEESIFNQDQYNEPIKVTTQRGMMFNGSPNCSPSTTLTATAQEHPKSNDEFNIRPFFLFEQRPDNSAGSQNKSLSRLGLFLANEERLLIENRHDSAESQHEYDRRFGIILKK